MNPMNLVYALSGLVLFSLYGWAMIVYGDPVTRMIALLAVLIGAISQFLAQDDNYKIVRAALTLSHGAILLGFIALVSMVGHYLLA